MPVSNEPRQREVRVFISSTFRDMHAERDHLVTVVFPELRERVERLGLAFFDVDLRWGVPQKNADGEKANSWEYCRQWIARVEPFFVGILGQRYGWVPAAGDFKSDEDKLRQESEPRSITDLEVRYAALDDRKKRRSYFYLRETAAPATASEYVDPPPLSGKLEQLKKQVRLCGRPVRDYPCEWTGNEFTGMDNFGRQVLDDLWSGVLRDERYLSKDLWRQVLGRDPDADPHYSDESQPVPRELWEKIVSLAKPEPKDPLDAEREQMAAFATARLRWFQGRTEELEQLVAVVRSTAENAPRLAVVAAEPGQGKSALLAKLSTLVSDGSTVLITHFVGATERSSSAHALVERLLSELDRSGIVWPTDQPEEGQEPKRDFNSLNLQLAQRLGNYAGERRIMILLDALNQLSDGHALQWLPARLGSGVRVVVSFVEDGTEKADSPEQRVLHAIASRQPVPLRIPLGSLTRDDVRTIVIAYLKEYCHELDLEHLDTLCAITQVRNPLYLLVMLNELRTLSGNDLNRIVPARIASMPLDHHDTVSLFRWVLQRLEVFGPEAVRWWCLYLAHGRVGMTSHELAELLARKIGGDAAATAPLVERGLRRYLLRRGPQLDFFHGQLRQAVFEQYGPQAELANLHSDIAAYLGTRWRKLDQHALSELPFHQTEGKLNEELLRTLMDFSFIDAKLRIVGGQSLIEDYERVGVTETDLSGEQATALKMVGDTIRVASHILGTHSEDLPQQLLLRIREVGAVSELLDECRRRLEWVPRWPSLEGDPALRRVLEGHLERVTSVTLTDNTLVSGSWDKSIRIWDLETGSSKHVLEGHLDRVLSVAVTTNAVLSGCWTQTITIVVSGSGDQTIRIWDLETGAHLRVLEGHTDRILSVAAAESVVVSGSEDRTVRIWDLARARCQRHVLEGHTDGVTSVALAGNIVVSGSRDRTIRIWDRESGWLQRVLEGHAEGVNSVALAGNVIVSGTRNGTIGIWDGSNGKLLRMWKGHSAEVFSVAVQGNTVVSGSRDRTIRIWDRETGEQLQVLNGRADLVLCVAVAGTVVVSGSKNRTIRIWEFERSEQRRPLVDDVAPEPFGYITSVAVAGKSVVSARSKSQTVQIWDPDGAIKLRKLWGHSDEVTSVAANGNTAVSGSADRTIRIWDLPSGEQRRVLEGHTGRVTSVAISGNLVVSGSQDGTVRIWDLQGGEPRRVLDGHTGGVTSVAIAGTIVVSSSEDGTIRIWDLQRRRVKMLSDIVSVNIAAIFLSLEALVKYHLKRKQRGVLEKHADVPGAVAVAGNIVASGSVDGTVRIWDLKTGKQQRLLGHARRVTSVAMAGNAMVSGSEDRTIRIWDLKNGECTQIFRIDAEAWSVAADRDVIAVGDLSGTLHEFFRVALPHPCNRSVSTFLRRFFSNP